MTSILVSWNPSEEPISVFSYHIWYTPVCDVNASYNTYLNTTDTSIIININETIPYVITVRAVNVLGVGLEANTTTLMAIGEDCMGCLTPFPLFVRWATI